MFLISGTGSSGYPYGEKMYLNLYLTPLKKYPMCTINLTINKTSKQLHRECLHDRAGKDFFKPDTKCV